MEGITLDKTGAAGMPYSILSCNKYKVFACNCIIWDKWAVGVMLLEIIVGSDIISSMDEWDKFEVFYRDVIDWIDDNISRKWK